MHKSDVDRFKMGFEMADIGRRMVEMNLTQQHPDWSTGQLKAAVFERIYCDDFTTDEMKRITESILAFHDRQTT
ncbi:hypothetical protein [Spirosoma arcticum]